MQLLKINSKLVCASNITFAEQTPDGTVVTLHFMGGTSLVIKNGSSNGMRSEASCLWEQLTELSVDVMQNREAAAHF